MSNKMSRLWKPLFGTNWRDPLQLDLKNIMCLINIKTKIQNSHIFKKNRHSIGPIDELMELLQVIGKGNFTNDLEKVYIHREPHLNNQLNGKSALGHNKIFGL
jgi:hypothetical protein